MPRCCMQHTLVLLCVMLFLDNAIKILKLATVSESVLSQELTLYSVYIIITKPYS